MGLFGWDASHYDWDRGPMNIDRAVQLGVSFMTHKVTEGTSYQDPRFDDFITRVSKTSMPLIGAYMVLVPARDPVAQADAFLARLDTVARGWRGAPFILQIDAEKFEYMTRGPSLAEIKACCDRIWSKTNHTHRPIVYAPKWYYGDSLTGLAYPLWASAYGSNPAVKFTLGYPGDVSTRWTAYSGQVPKILQYGSNLIIGDQPTCDVNVFRGTLTELVRVVSPGFDVEDAREDDVSLSSQEYDLIVRGNITPDNALFNWLRRIAEGVDPLTQKPTGVGLPQLAERLDRVLAQGTADVARDAEIRAAFDALKTAFDVVVARGTSVDTAVVLDAVHAVGSDVGQRVAELQTKLDDVTRERDELYRRLSYALISDETQDG